jgi:hypothetical protein
MCPVGTTTRNAFSRMRADWRCSWHWCGLRRAGSNFLFAPACAQQLYRLDGWGRFKFGMTLPHAQKIALAPLTFFGPGFYIFQTAIDGLQLQRTSTFRLRKEGLAGLSFRHSLTNTPSLSRLLGRRYFRALRRAFPTWGCGSNRTESSIQPFTAIRAAQVIGR